MRGKRGVGQKRSVRKSIQISAEMESKLNRLHMATGLPIATIMSVYIESCLNNVSAINWLQNEYLKHEEYRVTPIIENNKVILV